MIRTIYVLFFLYTSIPIFSQCGSGPCQLCDVTAKITSISGGDIIVNNASISGNVNGGETKNADQFLEVTSNSCGGLEIAIELDFNWDQGTKNNWIHGVSFKTSPNWLAAQGVIIPANNGWIFESSITGACSGNTYGAGYYWDLPGKTCAVNRSNFNGSNCIPFNVNCEEDDSFLIDGDPRDNYGVNCEEDCPNFGFELIYCPIEAGSNVEVLTFVLTEDGETGGYARSDNCIFSLNFPIKINSAGLQIPDLNPTICLDSCIVLDAGIGCDKYLWSTGDTTNYIEVCPQIETSYGVTVTAATGCEIIDTITVKVKDCCEAASGSFGILEDTLIICPFDTPEIVVTNAQDTLGYQNMIFYKKDSISYIYLDTLFTFNPPQYQFNHINQCDTFVIYAINYHIFSTDYQPISGEIISELDSDCFDIDSLVIIIHDDNPPSSDYPYTDFAVYEDGSALIKSYDTIRCISDLQDAIEITWSDDCFLRDTSLIETNNLEPCKLSYFGRLWFGTDHCSNTTVIRNWTTLFPDTLEFEVLVNDEYCIGENNGQLDIININLPESSWRINNGQWTDETHYEGLSSGQYFIDGMTSCGCIFSDTINIDSGTDINITLLDTICNDNGTLGIPDDDFYIANVIISGEFTLADSCSLYLDGVYLENVKYGEIYSLNINANQNSSTIEAFDLIKPECESSININMLNPCSGTCQIEAIILNEECNDNNTRGFPDDDYYNISIQVTATNTVSDSFQVLLNGMEIYRLSYTTDHTIGLPANGAVQNLTIQDLRIDACETFISTSSLIPCSGICQLSAEIVDIACNDNGTRSDPSDDTWSVSVTVQVVDGSNTISYQSGLVSGFFQSGDTITIDDITFDNPFLELRVIDSMLLDCDSLLIIYPPEPCSNCLSNIDILLEDENCISNNDGALWVTIDPDSLISIMVDNETYENGMQSLSTGDHLVNIIYGDSCLVDTIININLKPNFNIELPELYITTYPTTIDLEAMTDLDNSELYEIVWLPEDDLSCTDCLTPTFSGDTTTSIVIAIEDIFGCIVYDTTTIEVTIIPEVYFPNIISLQSAVNNKIYPKANTDILINRMAIYDRWGNQVFLNSGFAPNDPEEGWDGTYNGQVVASGVYIFQCNVVNENGEEEYIIGTVAVVK